MEKRKWIPVILATASLLTANLSSASITPQFQSGEHISLGDDVKIYFSANDPGQTGYTFHLANGLTVTYGEILGLADFYGVVSKPISSGATDSEQQARFLEAFNTLANNTAAVSESAKILAILHYDLSTVLDAMKKGEKPEEVLEKITSDNNRQFNCITGGGCDAMWWVKEGRYLQLAQQDFDHFGSNAWLAYLAGHEVAMATALRARASHNLSQLELAYAENAFACHFLSDHFAAGHLRSPRVELPLTVSPSVVGNLLVNYMHNEDDAAGLHIHNLRGDRWVVYGDDYYFSDADSDNRRIVHEVMQKSADEIYVAYADGMISSGDATEALLPIVDDHDRALQINIAPLFYWDGESQQLYRRSDVGDQRDYHWTTNWWGWSTLVLLASKHKLPQLLQVELVNAGHGADALRYGLLSDKEVRRFAEEKMNHSR